HVQRAGRRRGLGRASLSSCASSPPSIPIGRRGSSPMRLGGGQVGSWTSATCRRWPPSSGTWSKFWAVGRGKDRGMRGSLRRCSDSVSYQRSLTRSRRGRPPPAPAPYLPYLWGVDLAWATRGG